MTKPITIVQDDTQTTDEIKKSRKKIYIGIAAVTAIAATAVITYVLTKQDNDDCVGDLEFTSDLDDLVAVVETTN